MAYGPHRRNESVAGTVLTYSTATSASTVWGPGTLSGKAIKALGEATLLGFDKLIIRWRLVQLSSTLPNRSPETIPAGKLEKMYDDVLELSRLDYYDFKVRQKALRLIVMQIGSRETDQLLKCITKWPLEEICIFLSELVNSMSSLSMGRNYPIANQELLNVYRWSQLPSEKHDALPFLCFFMHLSKVNDDTWQAVMLSGFPSFLVELYDSIDHRSMNNDPKELGFLKSFDVLGVALVEFFAHPMPVSGQRLDALWPARYPSIQTSLPSRIMSSFGFDLRRRVWRSVDEKAVVDRLSEIELMVQSHVPLPVGVAFDVCFDLLEFSSNYHDTRFKLQVLQLIMTCIAIGDTFWDAFRLVLSVSPETEVTDVFHRITVRLAYGPIHPLYTKFTDDLERAHPGARPIGHFFDFALAMKFVPPSLTELGITTLFPHPI